MLYAHEVAQVRIIQLTCLIDYVIRSRSGSSENYTTCMFDWLCYTLTKWLKWELYNLHVWLIMLYAHEVAQVRIIQLACLIDYVIRSRSGSSENYTYNLHVWLIMLYGSRSGSSRIIQLACLIDYVIRSRSGSSVWLNVIRSRSGSSENYTTCMFDWLCYTLTKWLKWELYNLHVWLIMLYAHEVAQVRIIQLACLIDYVIRSRSGSSENYTTCMFDWLCYTLTKWLKWELYNLHVFDWFMLQYASCIMLTKWLKWELYNLHVWLIMLYAHEVAQVRIIQLACLIDYVIRSRSGSSENYTTCMFDWLCYTLTKWLKWELYNLHVWLIMLYAHEVAQVRIIQLACLIDYVIRSRSGSSENYTTYMFDWLCYTLTKWLKWELYYLHVWLIMLYAHEVAQVRIIQLACLIDYVIRSRSGSSENYTTCMFDWLCYTLTKWLKWELYNLHVWLIMLYAHEVAQVRIIQLACLIDYVIRLTKWLKWELYNLHVWLIMLYAHEVAQVRIIQLACLIDYVIRSRSGSSENYYLHVWLDYELTKWLIIIQLACIMIATSLWDIINQTCSRSGSSENYTTNKIDYVSSRSGSMRIIQLACLIDYVIRSRSGSSENYTTYMFDWLCYTLTKWLKWELYYLHVIDYVIRSRSGSSENYTTCMFDWLCYTLTKWLKWELYTCMFDWLC